MALYRLVDCGPGFSPWSDPAMVLPLRRFRRGLLLLDVQIDRQPVVALIDSGARLSSIRTEVAAGRRSRGIGARSADRGQRR